MRQYVIAATAAVGLIALSAAMLSLAAEPATERARVKSRAIARTLILCRRQNGWDQATARALAAALMRDGTADVPTQVSGRSCGSGQEVRASVARCD